jgi:hypothetical protein
MRHRAELWLQRARGAPPARFQTAPTPPASAPWPPASRHSRREWRSTRASRALPTSVPRRSSFARGPDVRHLPASRVGGREGSSRRDRGLWGAKSPFPFLPCPRPSHPCHHASLPCSRPSSRPRPYPAHHRNLRNHLNPVEGGARHAGLVPFGRETAQPIPERLPDSRPTIDCNASSSRHAFLLAHLMRARHGPSPLGV